MRSIKCVSRTRAAVIYGSFVLAACGWGGSVWSWLDHGMDAGINPGFIFALTVAATFTMTLAVTVVMPDKARLFSLGFSEGVAFAEQHQAPEPREPRRHLSVAP